MLWVNHGLDIDVVLPIVRRLLGFEPDTPFHWDIGDALTEGAIPVYTPAGLPHLGSPSIGIG